MPDLLKSIGQGFQRFGEGYNDPSGEKRAAAEAARARARYSDAAVQSIQSEEAARLEQLRREAFIQDAQVARTLVEQGRPDLAQGLLQQRMQLGEQMGLNMRDTQAGLEMLQSGKTDDFMMTTGALLSQWEQRQAESVEQGWSNVVTGSDGRQYGISKANPSAGLQPIPTPEGVTFGGSESGGFSASTQTLPDGSAVMVRNTGEVLVRKASGEIVRGEAANELVRQAQLFGAEIQGLRSGEREAGKQAVAMSGEAYEKLQSVNNSKRLLQSAIQAIDDGAETGPIMKRLPTVTRASAALDAVQKELGLNVLQNTTFGALSEKELEFALETGLPKNMRPDQLREWAQRKLDAQGKLEDYLYRAAVFLGTPGNTVADWLEVQKAQSQQDPAANEFDSLWGPD